MLTGLLLALLLIFGASVAMHTAIDERMQARPWRFLVPAIAAIVIAFFLQTSVQSLSGLLALVDPSKDHLADLKVAMSLLNIVVGAFAGGMIGAAVSLRAQILNTKKQASLLTSLAEISLSLEEAKKSLAAIESDATLSDAERLERSNKARQLVILHIMDQIEIGHELKRVSP